MAPDVCAHGGLLMNSSFVQNSLSALHASSKHGLLCTEVDASLSVDGILMAIHPRQRSLAAPSGQEIFDQTAHSLSQSSAGVPSLVQYLEHACDTMDTVIVDAKVPLAEQWRSPSFVAYSSPDAKMHAHALGMSIVRALRQVECGKRALVTSRSEEVLNVIAHTSPAVGLMQVVSTGKEAARLNATAAGVHWSALSLRAVLRYKQSAGLLLSTHVVNEEQELWKALQFVEDLSFLVSDAPLSLRALVRKEAAEGGEQGEL